VLSGPTHFLTVLGVLWKGVLVVLWGFLTYLWGSVLRALWEGTLELLFHKAIDGFERLKKFERRRGSLSPGQAQDNLKLLILLWALLSWP
jgi:hypothetical protein